MTTLTHQEWMGSRAPARRMNGGGDLYPSQGSSSLNVGGIERVGSLACGGALLLMGTSGSPARKLLLGALGGALLYRGVTGSCPLYRKLGVSTAEQEEREGADASDPHFAQRSITIGMSPPDLYERWLRPDVQARVFSHFGEVSSTREGGLRIQIQGPMGSNFDWEFATTEAVPGEFVRWQSRAGASLASELSASFRAAPRELGTELVLTLRLMPDGLVTRGLTKMAGFVPRLLVQRTLRNFKSLVEAGEIPTTRHNPAARASARLSANSHQQIHA